MTLTTDVALHRAAGASHDEQAGPFAPEEAPATGDAAPAKMAIGGRADWLAWAVVTLLLALVYGGMINPYWVMAGDGETYLGIARNLAQGDGFTHNGQVVGLVPPGWPAMLAGAMLLTDRLDLLKLLPVAMAVGFFSLSYWVLRRYVGITIAVATVLVVGLTWDWARLSVQFFTDLPFAFFVIVAALLAQRVSEAAAWGGGRWRLVGEPILLCLVVAVAVSIRFNGILLPAVTGAILVSGDRLWRPRLTTTWLTAVAAGLVCLAAFFACRWGIAVDPEEIDPRYHTHLAGSYEYVNSYHGSYTPGLLADRVARAGRWYGAGLWRPVHDLRGVFITATNGFGWLLVAAGAYWAIREARRRRYWLLGAFAFWLPVMLTWPNVMPRYALPVLPLLIAAALVAAVPMLHALTAPLVAAVRYARDGVAERKSVEADTQPFARRWGPRVCGLFVVATLLVNAPVVALELYVHRSGKAFYDRYLGGVHAELNDVARHLNEHADADDGIGVTYVSRKNGRYLERLGWAWAVNWLTDRPVQVIPAELSVDPVGSDNRDRLKRWMRARGLEWYVYQPPFHRYYHFPGGGFTHWLQSGPDLLHPEKIWTERPELFHPDSWQLWRVVDGLGFVRVPVSDTGDWPRRIPQYDENPSGPPWRGTAFPGGRPHPLDAHRDATGASAGAARAPGVDE